MIWGTSASVVSRNDDAVQIRTEVEKGQGHYSTVAITEDLPAWYRPHHYRYGHSRPNLRPLMNAR